MITEKDCGIRNPELGFDLIGYSENYNQVKKTLFNRLLIDLLVLGFLFILLVSNYYASSNTFLIHSLGVVFFVHSILFCKSRQTSYEILRSQMAADTLRLYDAMSKMDWKDDKRKIIEERLAIAINLLEFYLR